MQSRAPPLAAAAAWRGLLPSWPLLIGFAALARALAEPLALLHDPDTYLHIAAGRWMLEHRALPLADPFSHSMTGAPWISGEWLAELVLAAVYRTAGWGGVIVLSAAAFALAAGLLTRFLLQRVPPLPSLIAALAGIALVLPHLLARPHTLALPLLVLWSGALLAARDEGRPPPFAMLPLMILWANLHASFMFGLALAGFLAAEAVLWPGSGRSRAMELRSWGLFVLAAFAAALLTPNGIEGLLQPLRLMSMPALQASFAEWAPADLGHFPALELWLLGLFALGFLGGVRLPLPRLALLLALIHMALAHVRHADLLGLVGPLAVAGAMGPPLAAQLARGSGSALLQGAARLAAPAGLPAMFLFATLAAAAALPMVQRPPQRADDPVTPAHAVAAAVRLGLSGPVFNAESFGGYLVFAGIPSFIDGRIEMYGNNFLAREAAAERGDAAELRDLLARYRIGWTLLAPQSGAAAVLDSMSGWQRVYADDYAIVHRRLPAP